MVLVLVVSSTHELELVKTASKLPSNSGYSFAAVYDEDDSVYVLCEFGFLKYTLSTDTLTFLSDSRPRELFPQSVVRVSSGDIYVLGAPSGSNEGGSNNTFVWETGIFHIDGHDPVKTWTKVASIPGIIFGSVVWDGDDSVYVLGGDSSATTIRKFLISNHTLTDAGQLTEDHRITEFIPNGVWVSTQKVAYVFGRIGFKEILAYHPANNTVRVVGTLPAHGNQPGIVYADNAIYVLCAARFNDIPKYNFMRFDPDTKEITSLEVSGFDFMCGQTPVVYVEKLNRIYTFMARGYTREKNVLLEQARFIEYIDLSELTAKQGCSAVDKYGILYEAFFGKKSEKSCPGGANGTATWYCEAENTFNGDSPDYSN